MRLPTRLPSPSAAAATALALSLLSSTTTGVLAQECEVPVVPGLYTGTPFVHSLPATVGGWPSEITYFKLRDPSGQFVCNSTQPEADLSLVSYMSLNSTGGRPLPSKLQRALVVVTGINRDPEFYEGITLAALDAVPETTLGGRVNTDTVAVLTPRFSNGDDKVYAYPWNETGETEADRAYSPAVVWAGSQWSGGSVNQYPPRTMTVSAFDVLDQLVSYFADRERFPNMKQVIVSGHSMGSQMIQRYAAVGKTREQLGIPDDIAVDYYVGDPNSFAWLSPDRPLSRSKCSDAEYDLWREGLTAYSDYGADNSAPITYNAELVSRGSEAVLDNYLAKPIRYQRATQDLGDRSSSCAPYATGKDRNERFFEYVKRYGATCADPAGPNCDTVDYVDAGHDAPNIFLSPAGQQRLFIDNFDGDGARSPDFGYPRRAGFDDPYPDPERAGEGLLNTDAAVYAANMTYKGCWTDVDNAQTNATLGEGGVVYTGAENSRAFCAETCAQAGWSVSGTRTSECWCGNGVSAEAREVVSTSCYEVCPGNNTMLCGGPQRLSLLASVELEGEEPDFREAA